MVEKRDRRIVLAGMVTGMLLVLTICAVIKAVQEKAATLNTELAVSEETASQKETISQEEVFSKKGDTSSDKKGTVPYRNVMYYGDWSIYAGQKNFYPGMIDGSLLTHLNFAFLDVDADGELVLCDEHADFQTILPEQNGLTYADPYAGVLGAMYLLRSEYPNMKIGISVGGWTRSGDFAVIAGDEAKRKNFARNISKFVEYLGFDFVDIDWEYPTAVRESDPEGNGVTIDEGCKGSEADTQNFTLLLQEIRNELDVLEEASGKYYELSVAMSASPTMMAKVEYDKVLDIVDFANMMTYDMNGAWNGYTGHQTALYSNDSYNHETQQDGIFSVDTCVQYLEDTYGDTIDYSKIVIGVAPYTRGWAGVQNNGPDADNPGVYATAQPNSVRSADGTTSGTFAYTELDTLCQQYGLKEYYDEKAEAAYYYGEETGYFFTCDNERSVAAKGAYVREKGLGGLIAWMASFDKDSEISRVMKESLYGEESIPVQEIVVPTAKVSVNVEASGSTYTITLRNEETAVESNTALKDAELFKKTVMLPKLYIKTKSGATFSAGSESGSVTNEDECSVIDLSGIYAAKALKPGMSHTFTINCSGTADIADIQGITMTQRILSDMEEFGACTVYGEGARTGEKTTKPEEKEESSTSEVSKVKENKYTGNGELPSHMVTGYWHNFVNGSKNLKLSDVPSYYDMICVAFTGSTATHGEVTFELDDTLCSALGGYTKEEFCNDIKALQKKGQHVIVSVGGAEGRIEIDSQEAADIFAKDLIEILEEYGFEGVDIDLEGSAVSGVEYIAGALRKVQEHFGDSFIITMAPETYYIQADRLSAKDITTSYLRLALEIKDILTICYPQFYNTGGMNGYGGSTVNPGNADFLASLATLLLEAGLRPDQVAIGVPSTAQAAGSGYVTTDVVETAVKALVNGTSSGSFTPPKAYSDLRGVMTWSINWDATQDYAWGKAMSEAMESLEDGGNNAGTAETGNTVTEPTGETTWSADTVYNGGEIVWYNGKQYQANWWTQGSNPEESGEWGDWKLVP